MTTTLAAPSILGITRRFPCHPDIRARFGDLRPCTRRCRACGSRFEVSFESAVGASALTGSIVFKARWREITKAAS